ncbi:MAG: hypothetical protein AAGD11_00920 [Planctomycetota bacterium]
MADNPIVEEIRAIKHKLAAECDNDLSRIFAQLREQEKISNRTFVSLPPRPVNSLPVPPMGTNGESIPQPTTE